MAQYRKSKLAAAIEGESQNIENSRKSTLRAIRHAKPELDDPWAELETRGISNGFRVLRCIQNIRLTPPEILRIHQIRMR